MLVVAGMGMIAGDRASSQASAICEMVAPCRDAMGSRTILRALQAHASSAQRPGGEPAGGVGVRRTQQNPAVRRDPETHYRPHRHGPRRPAP